MRWIEAVIASHPDVTAAANSLIRPSAGIWGWDTRGAVGWPQAGSRCGMGLKIGMIDTPVDTGHRAFHFRHVTQKAFTPRRSGSVSTEHGTAIASLLVGNDDGRGGGGLVPGASLLAASIFEAGPGNGVLNIRT